MIIHIMEFVFIFEAFLVFILFSYFFYRRSPNYRLFVINIIAALITLVLLIIAFFKSIHH